MAVTQRRQVPTALITGASSGIGTALAEVFAEHGFDLVLVARDEARLNVLATRLRETHGIAARVISADLSEESSARRIHETVKAMSLDIDVLVNNAGMIVYGEFSGTDFAAELKMIEVNLIALTQLTKLFIPDMLALRKGAILNLGSNGSFVPSPLTAVYSATKAYVLSFSEAIAEELDNTGVTVTALCPGATYSELQLRAGMEDVRLLRRHVLDARFVAEVGYRAVMKGTRIAIPGWRERFEIAAIRVLPRRFVVRQAKRLLKRV